MALNPPLDNQGNPLRVTGEQFYLDRRGIEFQVKIDGMGKLKGKGNMILTSNRIILVNKKSNDTLRAFDLPLALMFHESFEQPIFGANYIKGKVKPLVPGSLPGDPEFKAWFMEGGCGKFLQLWRYCLKQIRDASQNR